MIGAVFVDDVVDHTATTFVVEVDIDIGHRDTVGIQEALKEEVVLDGVDVGDADTIGYGGTCSGTPAWANGYTHIAGRITEVLDNQKITGISSLFNGGQLKIDAFSKFVSECSVTLFGTFIGEVTQKSVFSTLTAIDGILCIDKLGRNIKSRKQYFSG